MTNARRRLIATLVVIATLQATPAWADWWHWIGWLEEMSGPGPFQRSQIAFDRVLCFERPVDEQTQKVSPVSVVLFGFGGPNSACRSWRNKEKSSVVGYVAFEFAKSQSVRNNLSVEPHNPDRQVGMKSFSLVAFKPVVPGIETGAGLTFNRLSGEGDLGEFGFARLSVPFRVRVLPGVWINPKSRWSRLVYLSLQADTFPQGFSGNDFSSAQPFNVGFETLGSYVVTVDLFSLFP